MMDIISLEYTDVFDDNKTKELIFSSHLIKEKYNQGSLFPLMVDGKSMEPVINDRAVIVTDLSQKELKDEAIYVLYHGDRMWVKKYKEDIESFVSINPDFSHLVYKKDEVHIVSRVLLTFTRL